MWRKKESKLDPAVAMIRQAMPALQNQGNVLLLFDSWYAKRNLVCIKEGYENLDIICNARHDSVIYDLAPRPTGKRGRPAKHGKQLSVKEDFHMFNEKIGDYFIGVRCVLTNLFADRQVMAYVTSREKEGGSRRLFFSTVHPEKLHIFCAWYGDEVLHKTGSGWMQYIPLFLYRFRWNIEISCYEQKTFWSLCRYMVRSQRGIETLINLINMAYCSMKLLSYYDKAFAEYKDYSVQEFRFVLSEKIREQVFIANFVKSLKNGLKYSPFIQLLKQRLFQVGEVASEL